MRIVSVSPRGASGLQGRWTIGCPCVRTPARIGRRRECWNTRGITDLGCPMASSMWETSSRGPHSVPSRSAAFLVLVQLVKLSRWSVEPRVLFVSNCTDLADLSDSLLFLEFPTAGRDWCTTIADRASARGRPVVNEGASWWVRERERVGIRARLECNVMFHTDGSRSVGVGHRRSILSTQ